MLIRCLSDLHLEFSGYDIAALPSIGEDLVVLSGDIGIGCMGIAWAQRAIPDRPVIYVLGNHEYYRQDFDELLIQARAVAADSNVILLENDSYERDGLRFLGCSLWTDFAAAGAELQTAAALEAERMLNDYEHIRRGPRKLRAADTALRCAESRAWLAQELAAKHLPTVVVTHHAPTLATQHPYFAGKLTAPSFNNDFDDLFTAPVRLWIHGHTHHSVVTEVNDILVVSNQRGYPREKLKAFRWDFLVEVIY